MLFLLLAVLCTTAILVAFKVFPKYSVNLTQAITVNYLVAVIFGLLQANETFDVQQFIAKPWLLISVFVGFSFIIVFYLFAESTQRAGVALTSVAAKMSVVIPVLLGFILFKDKISVLKITGIILALFAFYLTLKKKGKINLHFSVILFPLLIFLGNGLNDSLMKVVQHYHIDNDFEQFLVMVFLVALISGVVASFFVSKRKKARLSWRTLGAGLVLGLLNWYSTYFFIAGMQFFDVSVYVPLVSVSVVMLSSLIGFFIFREVLSRLNWAGIILAMLSIFLIATGNVLEESLKSYLASLGIL